MLIFVMIATVVAVLFYVISFSISKELLLRRTIQLSDLYLT